MPKHSTRGVVEFIQPPRLPIFDTVSIVLMIDAKVKITGISGREYLFNGAGSTQDVDERDVESLLEKRQGRRQCCGGTGDGNIVFELAGV